MKTFGWVVLAAIVILGGWLWLRDDSNSVAEQSPTPQATADANEGIGPDEAQLKASPSTQAARTYTQLVAAYTGKRIQFGMTCQATPATVTFKNGTTVMFDNRSGDARTITIDGTQYNFPGYGYRILTLSKATLPYTMKLSCGSAVNVGQIMLQR